MKTVRRGHHHHDGGGIVAQLLRSCCCSPSSSRVGMVVARTLRDGINRCLERNPYAFLLSFTALTAVFVLLNVTTGAFELEVKMPTTVASPNDAPPRPLVTTTIPATTTTRLMVADKFSTGGPSIPDVRCLNGSANLPFRYFDGQASFGVLDASHFPKTPSNRPLRIGFITYATGPYMQFALELWRSIQKYAFVGHQVHYFIFADKLQAWMREPNVHYEHQDRVGWPFDSLGRHFLYLSHAHLFKDMDYVLSIDSDTIVLEPLSIDMLGETVATMNAWFFAAPTHWWTYDARLTMMGRQYSAAYVNATQGRCYFGGGLFGGTVDGFVRILRSTTSMALTDINQNPPHVALWQDESYLNKHFFLEPPHVVLAPRFLYPEPPADKGLYEAGVWNDGNRRNPWLVEVVKGRSGNRRQHLYTPTIYNLGVRKYLDNAVDEYQPNVATVPSAITTMAGGGVDGGVGDFSNKQQQWQLLLPTTKRDVETQVTLVIKAFERPACLLRLLDSVADRYANMSVVVVDDSPAPLLDDLQLEAYALKLPKMTYKKVEYDIGLAAGRNVGLQSVKTEYFLLLDDDFVLSDESAFERLLDFLAYAQFDIAGGCVDSAHCYTLTKTRSHLRVKSHVACKDNFGIEPMYDVPGLACWQTDMINNFFMGRTKTVRRIGWDDRFKLGEHEDFFLRAKEAGAKVALCRGVSAINDNTCHPKQDGEYLKNRQRVFDFWVPMFEKQGLISMQTEAGNYTMKCDGGNGVAGPQSKKTNCSISIQQDFIWFGGK